MATSFTNPPLPEQPISIARREMDIEDYIDILRRHRSWILAPLFAGLVIGVVVAFFWPNSYRAEGTIRVVPPQVSSRLVETNISEQISQRVNTTYQNILSRQNLINLIQTYNLYPDDRKRLPTDDIVDTMRKDITMGQLQAVGGRAGRSATSFPVAFSYSDRHLAQKVCMDLMAKFVDENLKTRTAQSESTSTFFKEQYESAKSDLDELDAKIAAFRSKNMGQLPEQEQMIISRVTAMEANIQSINSQINRSMQDKLLLDSQLRELRDTAQALSAAPAPEQQIEAAAAARNDRLIQADREIEQLEARLVIARESYRDSHPDVQRLLSYLQSKKAQREQIAKDAAKPETAAARPRPAGRNPNADKLRETNSSISRTQAALQGKDIEIEDLNKQLRDVQTRLRNTQARLESTPAANQDYIQLLRDKDLATSRYNDLSKKMQVSSMASELESKKQGEMLEILETPVIPEEPYAPKRLLIIGAGLALGALLGAVLAAGREVKDTSLKNLKDVRAYTKLTILGSIPLLENDFVVRRRRRMGLAAWAATFLIGLLLMGGSIAYYFTQRA
ncbi:MAG TPA: GNVR domain-containing protein [Paludibaculum sp.]|jgi:polysaccharide chain length determinant protein (PEP-CTERM system associated)